MEGKPSLKKGDLDDKSDVNLNEVLKWLRDDVEWLRKHSKQTHLGKYFMDRVKGLRASIYGCSVLIAGLKQEDLELRVKELEETIKNGVVIPGEEKPKR